MINFIAIDFETANNNRHSICSIGIAWVENGVIVKSEERLVKPTPNDFDWFNSNLHGITASLVENEPTFEERWRVLKDEFKDKTIVAHYTGFDMSALRDAITYYGLAPVDFNFLCTMICSRIAFDGFINYTLGNICNELGIEMEQHHNAKSDAVAAAEIMLAVCKVSEVESIEELVPKIGVKSGVFGLLDNYKPCRKKIESYSYSVTDLDSTNKDISEDNPFYGRTILFTGTLNSMTRLEAWQRVVDNGGTPAERMTINVGILVVGGFDIYGDGFVSSKIKKAKERIAKGDSLEIITEAEFIRLLINKN